MVDGSQCCNPGVSESPIFHCWSNLPTGKQRHPSPISTQIQTVFTEIDVIPPSNITANSSKVTQPEGKITEENFDMDNWETIHINQGENLSIIFDRLKLQPSALYQVMSASEDTSALKHLLPKQALRFLIEDGKLMSLEYAQDLTSVLKINWEDGKYTSDIIKTELTVHTREVSASIDSSLFLAGQKAGLSDNLIMQLIAVYGWDIDFALDIRRGDSFKVIYEEKIQGRCKNQRRTDTCGRIC